MLVSLLSFLISLSVLRHLIADQPLGSMFLVLSPNLVLAFLIPMETSRSDFSDPHVIHTVQGSESAETVP